MRRPRLFVDPLTIYLSRWDLASPPVSLKKTYRQNHHRCGGQGALSGQGKGAEPCGCRRCIAGGQQGI